MFLKYHFISNRSRADLTPFHFDQIANRYILFGEWCYARHSVFYDRLPDWFLGFDIFDKNTAKFFSCSRRDQIFRVLEISRVPMLGKGHFSFSGVQKLLSQSQLSKELAEGLYLRVNQEDWLEQRAKLVRPAFIQSVEEHWSRSGIKANRLRLEATV